MRIMSFITHLKERKMEIPGIAPHSNQPTLTNPLKQSETLQGQQTQAQSASEAPSTVTLSEQATTGLSETAVINQSNEATAANNSNTASIGATIDITV